MTEAQAVAICEVADAIETETVDNWALERMPEEFARINSLNLEDTRLVLATCFAFQLFTYSNYVYDQWWTSKDQGEAQAAETMLHVRWVCEVGGCQAIDDVGGMPPLIRFMTPVLLREFIARLFQREQELLKQA